MYVHTPIESDSEHFRLGQPSAKKYKAPYDKGGTPIGESDGQNLLTILQGPSPYRSYILQNMATKGAAPPKDFLHVVTNVRSQVPQPLQHLFKSSDKSLVAGTIDRWTRSIYMIQAPGVRNATRLEYALHEGVHLVADPVVPAAGACPRVCVGTFQRRYGTGFGEGATQAITEAIMDAQNITPYYRDRPYEVFTRPMRKILQIFSLELFARAYFLGVTPDFTAAMVARWGQDWMSVAGLTTTRDAKKAVAEIDRLEAAHFNRLQRRGPKGDFPTLTRLSTMA